MDVNSLSGCSNTSNIFFLLENCFFFSFSSLFSYYKAINATAKPERVSFYVRAFVLSWGRYLYIITANAIETRVSCRPESEFYKFPDSEKKKRGINLLRNM